MREAVITGGARTAWGRLLGSLKDFTGAQLGGVVIRAALERSGVTGDQADYVIMGQVLQAGAGQNPARQAAVAGGVPMTVPAITVNKVCLSGLEAIALAAQLIRAGEFDVVVAGGMESMTRAPHLLPGARFGTKYGSLELLDAMAWDGLTDAFDGSGMGELTERHITHLGISRAEQDEFAARSHQLAAAAIKNGVLDGEIVGVPVPQRRGEPVLFDTDEGVRPETTVEALSALRPAFSAEGTITAGTSSQISDGACAVVVMSAEAAAAHGAPVLATVGAQGVAAGPDNSIHSQPSAAIRRALDKAGLSVADLDLVEINEAFAAIVIQSMRDLSIGLDKVNVNGGGIALGHPIGASGARISLHLIHELGLRGGGRGAAALCGGGGQGGALLFQVPPARPA
jgi:acetyl-CoA C-acetyltransferase